MYDLILVLNMNRGVTLVSEEVLCTLETLRIQVSDLEIKTTEWPSVCI